MPTDRTFTGYLERGPNSALHQAGARFYSGALGRFLSPDPLAAAAGDPRTLNPYAYAANNPLRYTDPSGMYPFVCVARQGIPSVLRVQAPAIGRSERGYMNDLK